MPKGRTDYAKTEAHKKPEAVPQGFDYNTWLGPAPDAPYAPARCHVKLPVDLRLLRRPGHRLGGATIPTVPSGAWGPKLTGPLEIRRAKGVFPPDELWNTATEYSFEAVYENGVTMIISSKEKMGVTFEGTEGKDLCRPGQAGGPIPNRCSIPRSGPVGIHLYKSDDHFRKLHRFASISRQPTGRAGRGSRTDRSRILPPGKYRHENWGRERLRWDPRAEQILGRRRSSQDAKPALIARAPWALAGHLISGKKMYRSSPEFVRHVLSSIENELLPR